MEDAIRSSTRHLASIEVSNPHHLRNKCYASVRYAVAIGIYHEPRDGRCAIERDLEGTTSESLGDHDASAQGLLISTSPYNDRDWAGGHFLEFKVSSRTCGGSSQFKRLTQ